MPKQMFKSFSQENRLIRLSLLTLMLAPAQETYANGGLHYHYALKLSGVKKWLSVKRKLQ